MSWCHLDDHEPEVGDDGLTDAQREALADEARDINCRHLVDIERWRDRRGVSDSAICGVSYSATCEIHGGCLGIGTDCGCGCCPNWEAERATA